MLGELEAAAADWVRDLLKHKPHPAPPPGTLCANCEAELVGRYCHVCGQNSDQHKRSMIHLVAEAIEGLFEWDSRLWRTLPALLFTPGRLARDYIEGRMARHVPPFRTFLVALLLFIFAAEHAVHVLRQDAEHQAAANAEKLKTPQGRAAEAARIRTEAVKDRADNLKEAAADRAEELRDKDMKPEAVERAYQRDLTRAQQSYDKAMAKADLIARGQQSLSMQPLTADEKTRREMAAKIRSDPDLSAKTTKSWLKEGIAKAVENPDYYLTVMFNWAHRLAVLLLPIMGLSLALVYFYRRRFYLYDHLLVAMNLLSFTFLTNAFGMVLPQAAWPYWAGLLAIWTPINMFQTLRGGYGSSIFGAIVKTLVVWTISVVSFGILLTALLVFTLSQV